MNIDLSKGGRCILNRINKTTIGVLGTMFVDGQWEEFALQFRPGDFQTAHGVGFEELNAWLKVHPDAMLVEICNGRITLAHEEPILTDDPALSV